MTVEELSDLEKQARATVVEPMLLKSEEEKAKEFLKEVDKASRLLWMKILRAGNQGLLIEDLMENAAEDRMTPSTAKLGIERLVETGKIRKVGWDRIVAATSVSTTQARSTPERDVYDVTVEKIHSGSAVVLVNDKWKARMTAQDFEGPTGIIKKDAKFKATGTLYRDGNTLCLRVRQVTQILS
jgi:hypothetical protein